MQNPENWGLENVKHVVDKEHRRFKKERVVPGHYPL